LATTSVKVFGLRFQLTTEADLLQAAAALDYVLRASDQRARASVRVQEIGVFVSYVTATF